MITVSLCECVYMCVCVCERGEKAKRGERERREKERECKHFYQLFLFTFRDSADPPRVETLTYQSVLQNELLNKNITEVQVCKIVASSPGSPILKSWEWGLGMRL